MEYSLQFVIGTAITWWGLGVLTVALAWMAKEKREQKRVSDILKELFGESGIGHVIDFHPVGATQIHAHCICGEQSLNYEKDDPTADRLMEQWADMHVEKTMESVGK